MRSSYRYFAGHNRWIYVHDCSRKSRAFSFLGSHSFMTIMILVTKLTEANRSAWARLLVSGHICRMTGGAMWSTIMVPRRFRLAKAFTFAFTGTIRSIWGTIHTTERFSREDLVGRDSCFYINEVHEVGERRDHSTCHSPFICFSAPSILKRKWKFGYHALQILRMIQDRQAGKSSHRAPVRT